MIFNLIGRGRLVIGLGMAFERKWEQVLPVNLISDGGENGLITVSSTDGFKVKQIAVLKADNVPTINVQIKRVISPTQMYVGPSGSNIESRSDVSQYTVALNASIEAAEQERPNIPQVEHERAVYEEEPVLAKRVVLVDKFGGRIDEENPIPSRDPDKVDWDEFTTTFPSPITEIYTYKKNSVTVMTVSVTYETNAKKTIIALQKTRV